MYIPKPFPGEIWSLIYEDLEDPTPLARSNRYLRLLFNNPFMISRWIIRRYTLEFAFLGALHWYLSKYHSCTSTKCDFESRQIQVAQYLIDMNVKPSDLEEFVMKGAAKMRHLRYVEWILNSNFTGKARCDLLLDAIKSQDEALIRLLCKYNSTTTKSIEAAFNYEIPCEIFSILVDETEPTIDLLVTCLSRASMTKWFSFKKRQDEIITRIKVLLEKTSDVILNENSDHLMIAASELGSIPLVKYLRERGGNINLERGAPLYTALLVGNINLIKYLVSLTDISLDIFSIPRASLVVICIIDHIAVLYALIATTTSVIMSFLCRSYGYVESNQVFLFSNTCASTSQGNFQQQLLGFVFSLILFLLLQLVMPLYGISGSLLYIFVSKRQIRLVHPST